MSRREIKARRKAARAVLKEYLAGGQESPLVLSEVEGFCACEVVFPSLLSKLRLACRYVLLRVACLAPMIAFGSFQRLLLRLAGVKVGRGVCVAPRVSIDAYFPRFVEIGDDSILGEGSRIFTHEYTATSMRIGPVKIGKGSVIGAYSTVRCGVTIGDGVTIGFNSYVNRDVPDGATVGGVPAKPLKRDEEEF